MNSSYSIDELVKRIKELKPGDELHIHDGTENSDIYGIAVIEKFETFFLLINSIGGGTPFMAEIGEDHFPMEAEQELLIYLSDLELNDFVINEGTKTFNFGQSWQMYGTKSVQVPAHFTLEQSKTYVEGIWDQIDLAANASYVQDSDKPDFDCCDFSE